MTYDYDRKNPVAGRCIEAVSTGPWYRRHQCRFKIKVERHEGGYCNIHDPVKVSEKAAAADAKYKEENERLARQRALGYLGGRACKALQRLHEVVELGLDINLYDGGDEVREILKEARAAGWEYE